MYFCEKCLNFIDVFKHLLCGDWWVNKTSYGSLEQTFFFFASNSICKTFKFKFNRFLEIIKFEFHVMGVRLTLYYIGLIF